MQLLTFWIFTSSKYCGAFKWFNFSPGSKQIVIFQANGFFYVFETRKVVSAKCLNDSLFCIRTEHKKNDRNQMQQRARFCFLPRSETK